MAFRSVGLIIASVVNSMQESQIVIQLLYLPMLMLSGATVPLNIMPDWLQTVAQFLPATHLYLGMTGILVRGESRWQNAVPVLAMLVTIAVGVFLSMKLFRWEKEEKLKPSAKLWVLAVLAPFLPDRRVAVVFSARTSRNRRSSREECARDQTWLVRGARLFVGDGTVIDNGGLLIRDGRIDQVFTGAVPDPRSVSAEPIEAYGKTALARPDRCLCRVDARRRSRAPTWMVSSWSDAWSAPWRPTCTAE